jgi:oxaloacetate decarboxylase gamma subunit
MQGSIVAQGVELMLYGMGTVALFLALLVVATTAMSALVTRYFTPAEAPPTEPVGNPGTPTGGAGQPDPRVVAAIAAAIHRHRARK